MTREVYRYEFRDDVSLDEVHDTLLLSLLAVEALHGEAQVRMDAGYFFAEEQRACVIDGSTVVGRDFCRIFTGFLTREFGQSSFDVERFEEPMVTEHAAA